MKFLDIRNAVFKKVGLDIELSPDGEKVLETIGDKKKTVFFLIDGMGYLLLKNILPESFLLSNVKDVARAICPSTTSAVLTAIATGENPATHSVNGWFNYLEETDSSVISLPFISRFKDKPSNAKFTDLFIGTSQVKDIPIRTSTIASKDIYTSEYSVWSRGATKGYGYSNIDDAFFILKKLLKHDDESEYIYVYFDEFDSTCHKYGTDSKEAKDLLTHINELIKAYADEFSDVANTIITADHGQVNIKNEDFFTINSKDSLMNLLKAPPSGDTRFVCFHTKEGLEEEFRKEFTRRYGQYCKIYSQDELDKSHLLGEEDMSKMAKKRFGDFCAIFDNTHAFLYVADDFDRSKLKKGCHSGLADEEMQIPFICF